MSDPGRIVFVGGLSGSGRTTAMAALEDLSFYCVDNLPPQLIPQFLDLCTKATPPIRKIALAVDAQEERFLGSVPGVVSTLRGQGKRVEVIFLDCADEVLVNRYRETRRVHPLSPSGSVDEGIRRERHLLVDLSALADFAVDTSTLNVHQLRETIIHHVSGETRSTVVNLISFGFRYGTPQVAELLFDLRFLPNPYFEESLRHRTGREPEVAEYVMKSERSQAFFARLTDLLSFLLPLYDQEGKSYLTVAVGCTGGQHRSVVIAEALASRLREQGREVNLEHRDVERGE
ncbi:MAG: RNase adapter RapZ [Proteobacteria bacterium]|nr:RNase adapter RapZ [Pseudomonadota bacterium]